MKTYPPSAIRNFALVGHQSSGKTSLSEAFLACAGTIQRMGSVGSSNTVSDYHEDERERKISIHSSLLNFEWMERKFNVIDTPGYLDFISEGLGALRVGDFALVVVNANNGIELGTEQVWEYATQYGIPKMIVINGFDREHTDFDKVLAELSERFGRVFPMNRPINPGPGWKTVLDVMRNEVVEYAGDQSGKYKEVPAQGEWKETVDTLHRQLIEYVAESDDSLLERFFEEGNLSEEDLRAGLHKAIQEQVFVPVFCTAAASNIGVARLMDFIAKYGSSPVDRATVSALDDSGQPIPVSLTDPDPVCYVFKTISEPHVGDLSFIRLYSGSVRAGMDLINTDRGNNERFGQIFTLNGRQRTGVESLGVGDIGAVVKLRDTHTGNTLCGPKRRVTLPKVQYPSPNIHGALVLKNKGDEDRLANGLSTLHEEDPTFLYRVDSEVHQTIISGQGELHLAVITDRLRRRFNVDLELIEPRVPFRETIKGRGESKYRHKKQTGGAGQFAEVWLRVEPAARDEGVVFKQSLVGQNVDRVFVPSVEKGVMSACQEGVFAHCRVVDVKAEFYDGKMHPVDSKDVAFQIAGKAAFKEAFLAAKPCLLEPIYTLTIKIPESCLGDVMGDISGRRGKILGMEAEGHYQIIKAQVPQMELYRYSTVLRSLTGGRGIHSEVLDHYEEMPRELEQKVIAQRHKEHAEASGH